MIGEIYNMCLLNTYNVLYIIIQYDVTFKLQNRYFFTVKNPNLIYFNNLKSLHYMEVFVFKQLCIKKCNCILDNNIIKY